MARVDVDLDNGFAAYALTDPVIIGDVTGDGTISAQDTSYIARKTVGNIVAEVPDLPANLPPIPPTGPDPIVTIPPANDVRPGTSVMLPLSIQDAADLYSALITVRYETQIFDVANSDLTLGTLPSGWELTTNVNDSSGTIVALVYSAVPLATSASDLVRINYHVQLGAPAGTTRLDIDQDVSYLNEGTLTITGQDGIVTIINSHAPGDLNRDGRVDRADLSLLLLSYGLTAASMTQGDLNNDGRIGVRDLVILQANWSPTAPSPPAAVVVSISADSKLRLKASRSSAYAVDEVMATERQSIAPQFSPRVLRAKRKLAAAG
jgi:hypothetical protein